MRTLQELYNRPYYRPENKRLPQAGALFFATIPPMNPRPVAVFDIDGTLFRSSLLIELVEELVSRGVFPQEAKESYEGQREDWMNRKGEYEPFIHNVVRAFGTYAKGTSYEEVAHIAGEIIESQKDRVYRYTRDLAHEYKDKGYYLLAISHSPKFIVDGFAYELGFHKSYGTFYESGASERFTGEIADQHLIMNKSAVLKRAVEKEGLTLHRSLGVGDTESDISMLTMVETPIAFNPNRLLYRHALQHEWKVVVERKDVIYEL
jgi:HAD superfamily hydrolase (TIGR01490 family)